MDGVDVTKDEGVGCLVEALEKAGNPTVDILINNAGVMLRSRNALDVDVLRESMEVNAYGAIRVTTALLRQRLLASPGAKIALITSKMGSMADNTSGGAYGYRMSKAALNAAGVSLAHDLKGDGMAVALLHPGERGRPMYSIRYRGERHGRFTPKVPFGFFLPFPFPQCAGLTPYEKEILTFTT